MITTANANWEIVELPFGKVSASDAQLAVLMDIRRELQTLNRVFACQNALDIPWKLNRIRDAVEKVAVNTTKKPRRRKKVRRALTS